MAPGSGSSQTTPMASAFAPASTRTVVRPDGISPSAGSLCRNASAAGAAIHACSSSTPSIDSTAGMLPACSAGACASCDHAARDTTAIASVRSALLKRLVLRLLTVTELVREVVVTGGLEPDGHVVIRGVFPIPAVYAGKRRGQRTGCAA